MPVALTSSSSSIGYNPKIIPPCNYFDPCWLASTGSARFEITFCLAGLLKVRLAFPAARSWQTEGRDPAAGKCISIAPRPSQGFASYITTSTTPLLHPPPRDSFATSELPHYIMARPPGVPDAVIQHPVYIKTKFPPTIKAEDALQDQDKLIRAGDDPNFNRKLVKTAPRSRRDEADPQDNVHAQRIRAA